jgi:cytochrome P450
MTADRRPPRAHPSPRKALALFDRRRTPEMFAGVARLGDVAELRMAGHRIWVVSDPTLARQVLVDHTRSLGKGVGIRLIRLVLGNGILTNEDPADHRRNRRLINPAFATAQLGKYADAMVAAADRAGERWQRGAVVEITDEMQRIALDVVGRTLLGDETDRDTAQVMDAVAVVLKRFGLGFIPYAEKLINSPLPTAVKIRAAIQSMWSTVDRIVRDHQSRPEDYDDIVGSLIAANEDGETLSAQQVRDETLTLMLAGFETTANALAWAWWLLDANPAASTRLREELYAVLGDRTARFEDVARLPYAMAVMAETLRLRPPAWIIEREVNDPIELGGYRAERGTALLMSPWIIHRDPRWWGEDAAAFRPDRWINATGEFEHSAPGQPRGAYFPFGAGSRMCIGEQFAWSEAVLVLATLARRWAPVTEPAQQIGIWAAVTLRPHPGIRMRLEPAPVGQRIASSGR